MTRASATVGIFVGGRSTRMGSPKGLLPHPDGDTLLAHAVRAARAWPCLLVGDASSYEGLVPNVPRLADAGTDIGPIAGLAALLAHAETSYVVVIACDMPFVTAPILEALIEDPADVTVLAARRSETSPWEPMLSRWRVHEARPAITDAITRGAHGLSRLIEGLPHATFSPSDPRASLDWDTPEDVIRHR